MPPQYQVDAMTRPIEDEIELNVAFAQTFGTPHGQVVLDYLRSLTLNTVLSADVPTNHLWMQEGARNLFRIMQTRMEDGQAGRPARGAK